MTTQKADHTPSSALRFSEVCTVTQVSLAAPDEKGHRRFSMTAYTGGEVQTYFGRMVVDLSSMDLGPKRKPILLNHDTTTIAGYSDDVQVTADGILITGRLSKTTASGREVAELADEGFPWQASIGFNYADFAAIPEGETAQINGKEFAGPISVLKKSKLKESSFVPLGADPETSAAVFSDGLAFKWFNQKKDTDMSEKDTSVAIDAAFKDGYATAKKELGDMLTAFPNEASFAVSQFSTGQSLTQAKLARAEMVGAELIAVSAKLAAAEKKLSFSVGTQSAVGSVEPIVTEVSKPKPTDPKLAAEWEFDNQQATYASSSREKYVAVRTAELSGRLRMLSK